MTYCAAFKYQGEIFVVSDSASTSQEELEAVESVFGEQHPDDGQRRVEDGVKKIFSVADEIMTFAGSFNYGIKIAQSYIDYREKGYEPFSAFELAFLANSPAPHDHRVSMILGCQSNDGMELLLGRSGAPPSIERQDDFISVGANEDIRKNFDDRLKSLIASFKDSYSTGNILAQISASCLGVSLPINTIGDGVGGAFYSIALTARKREWLGDTLMFTFSLEENGKWPQIRDAVTLGVRNDVFVTRKNIGEATTTSGQFVGPDYSIERLKYSIADAKNKVLITTKTGKYSHIAFVNYENGKAHVLDMRRACKHFNLILTPPKVYTGKVTYGTALSPDLRQRLEDNESVGTSFESFNAAPSTGHPGLNRGIPLGNRVVI